MKGRTKQFKIGEYVVGGIIQVDVVDDVVSVIFKDSVTKETVIGKKFNANADGSENAITNYLEVNSTAFYADKVLTWINSVVELRGIFSW